MMSVFNNTASQRVSEKDNKHNFSIIKDIHCLKSVRTRSFSSLYFSAFILNTERYGVSLRIQSECGKMWTRKTPNMDTFNAVIWIQFDNGFFFKVYH